MEIQWLICGGCPRSGTTLLNNILNTNPSIFLTNEQNLGKVLENIDTLFFRDNSVKNQIERTKGKKENWSKKDIYQNTFKRSLSTLPVLKSLYVSNYGLSDYSGRCILGDKRPIYWKENWELVKEVLNPKVIHISRHPYDVANSYFRRTKNTKKGFDYWKKDASVDVVCNDWIDAWNHAVKNIQNENFLHLKYEDLIFNSNRVLNHISSFLEIPNTYDKSLIITDHHYEREMLSKKDINKIDDYLNQLSKEWENDLPDLELVGELVMTEIPHPV